MTPIRLGLSKCCAALALIAGLLLFSAKPVAAKNCDRACLGDLLTQYLHAMVAHNPGALPLASHVRYTENGEVTKLGEGIWRTASGLGSYRQDILDVPGHTAATQAVIEAAGQPVLFSLRLGESGGKISQIESMVVPHDKDALIFNPAGFQKGNEEMAIVPPASQIDSRAKSIEIAMTYPEGLKVGSFVQVNTLFSPDGYRIENGIHTAGPGCTFPGCANIKTEKIIKHPDVATRFVAFDDHLGIVLLYLDFGQTERYGQGRKLVTFEAFKIYGGQIHAVNAILRITSVGASSGWGPEHPVKLVSSVN
jgi:hypothetical protein